MLPLIIAPDPILRTKAQPVELPPQPKVIELADKMIAAMLHYHGLGLAAPQIGQSLRLIVIATPTHATAYLNPEILKLSWRKVDMEEGCLSLPGLFGLVRRPSRVLARYATLLGETQETWLEGLIARVFQHEVDHLNGILFIDRKPKFTQGRELLSQYQGT